MLCDPRAGWQPISPWSDLFEGTGPRHSRQRASVNALMSYVLSPQDGVLFRKAKKVALSGPPSLRRFAYTHGYL